MRRSCLAFSCFCHAAFQSWVISRFMLTNLAALRGLWMVRRMFIWVPPEFAASFAALSAFSLPSMPLCPGTHLISMAMCRVEMRVSSFWIAEIRIRCPDCLLGLLMPWIADWLSAYITHFAYESGLSSAIPAANSNAVTSALYMLCPSSDPRYCWCVCDVFGEYAAAPTCPSIPEPSVYMVRVFSSW